MFGTSTSLSRRNVLAGAAGLAGVLALGACNNQTTGPGTGTGGGNVVFPKYIPMTAATPDIPAASEFGYPGYLSFPKDPKSVITSKPLSGETITSAAQLQAPAPAPMENNSWWQAINTTLGGTLKMDAVAGADYVAKISTLMAGNQLPDLVQIPNGLPNRADALAARFTELSAHLGGDKVAEYSQLANLTEQAWRGATFKGGIYGVPMPLGFVSSRLITREDLIKQHGLTSDVKSADEYFELCKGITDTSKNQWALGDAKSGLNSFLREMYAVPQGWEVSDSGQWTRDIETDQYVAALEFLKKLWDAGVIHPDAFGTINLVDLYKGGRVLIMPGGGAGMVTTYNLYADAAPGLEMGMPVAPKADGSGQARKTLGSGIYTLTAIPNSVPADRVPVLLHVLNTLGAGFGTQEYLTVQFGAEGSTWAWDEKTGSPKATPKAQSEKLPVNYLPGAMAGGYYAAGYPDIVKTATAYEKRIFEQEPVLDPSQGLYSPTEANSKATLDKQITDAIGEIIQGRKQLSDWPKVVEEWRNGGGDKIREELQQAAAEGNGK